MILSAGQWANNGDLIADVFAIPTIREAGPVVDLTYGEGKFWTKWRPDGLVAHDLKVDGVDFTALPEADGSYGVAVFDPPYTHGGGTKGESVADFQHRYGVGHGAPTTWGALLRLVLDGFAEAARVTRKGGFVIVKSMPYVASGRLRHTPFEINRRAHAHGCRLYDEFVLVRRPGPDTARRANGQLHARHNHSVLQVFEVTR